MIANPDAAVPGFPIIPSAGDNEWTDCDKVNAAQPNTRVWNSLNRLSFLRKTFFSNEWSQGQKKMKQEVQVC